MNSSANKYAGLTPAQIQHQIMMESGINYLALMNLYRVHPNMSAQNFNFPMPNAPFLIPPLPTPVVGTWPTLPVNFPVPLLAAPVLGQAQVVQVPMQPRGPTFPTTINSSASSSAPQAGFKSSVDYLVQVNGLWQCKACMKTFEDSTSGRKHATHVHMKQEFKCDVLGCDFATKCRKNKVIHDNNNHGIVIPNNCELYIFKCSRCAHAAKNASDFKKHLQQAHGVPSELLRDEAMKSKPLRKRFKKEIFGDESPDNFGDGSLV